MEYLRYVCRWSFLPSILAIFRDILAIYIASMLKIFFHKYEKNRKYTHKIASTASQVWWRMNFEIASMMWHTCDFFHVYLRFFSLVMLKVAPLAEGRRS